MFSLINAQRFTGYCISNGVTVTIDFIPVVDSIAPDAAARSIHFALAPQEQKPGHVTTHPIDVN